MFIKLYTGELLNLDKIDSIVPVKIDKAIKTELMAIYKINELESFGFNVSKNTYVCIDELRAEKSEKLALYSEFYTGSNPEYGYKFVQKEFETEQISIFKVENTSQYKNRLIIDKWWFYPRENWDIPVYYKVCIGESAYSMRIDEYESLMKSIELVKIC